MTNKQARAVYPAGIVGSECGESLFSDVYAPIMRTLVVTPHSPWPEHRGVAIRIANTVRGLAQIGEVDLFLIADGPWEPRPVAPVEIHLGRIARVVVSKARVSLIRRPWWLTHGTLPKHFLGRDYRQARAAFRTWNARPYDVVWLFRMQSYVAVRGSLHSPTIVDLDDLEDHKAAARRFLEPVDGCERRLSLGRRLRRFVADVEMRHDIPLLRQLQAEIIRSAEAVVVCKEQDRERLRGPNLHVIPNGYHHQPQPVGNLPVHDPPVVMFPGVLTYGPNSDGAQYFVRRIAPLLRAQLPKLQIRLVGEAAEEVWRLHHPPHVIVTGFVPEITSELARADVIAVPLRYGGGTRIKILEAFAHRIPVVSTTAGAEGIDAIDGDAILVADSPSAFAERCARLLRDINLRRRVVEAAHLVFMRRYDSTRIQEMVAALARRVARGGAAV